MLNFNQVMDEEVFLTVNGASRFSIGESALHKNRGKHSDKVDPILSEKNVEAEKERPARKQIDEFVYLNRYIQKR